MRKNEVTVAGMIMQMINSNQLSDEEEILIRRTLDEKQGRRECHYGNRCLAEAVETEMTEKMEQGIIKIEKMYNSVFGRCFKETSVGTMDSHKLTEKTIRKFEKEVEESFRLNKNEMIIFKSMLKSGLNKMASDGMLDFAPYNSLSGNPTDSGYRVFYIENPYTQEETEKIMKWSQNHPADVRGMAVSLWFAKGITLTEIVNLTKKDCWEGVRTKDSIMQFEKDLLKSRVRAEIVWKSVKLHPKEVKEVFVIPKQDGSGWKKLTEWGLQRKLWFICQDIGIVHKRINKNEAIKING
ncbi:MAG: DUF787 family protein [Lachnospiraceae bacterium]|nr:DUF787 family protein [Lachnospiraceae bacterium]